MQRDSRIDSILVAMLNGNLQRMYQHSRTPAVGTSLLAFKLEKIHGPRPQFCNRNNTPYNEFSADGEQCLNCLSHLRGQVQEVICMLRLYLFVWIGCAVFFRHERAWLRPPDSRTARQANQAAL